MSQTVITIGETMVLVTPVEAEPLETANAFRLDVGGAESNVASHLCSLGTPSAWVSQLGDDALGRRVERLLRERQVDTGWVRRVASAPTGAYFKDPGNGVQYFRAGSAASLMNAVTVAEVPLETARLVHMSGITEALSASCAELVAAVIARVAAAPTLLSFDVNYRGALWSVAEAAPALARSASGADIVFVGLDEAHTLWDTRTPDDVRTKLPHVPYLIVKDGDVGATEYSPAGTVFVPATPTAVVEAVGAGDAFAAGYLHSFLQGQGSAERLQAGHDRAVLVLQSTSDFLHIH
ncbi:sugar kinase [Cryobacterium sp. PH31-L1]|uniref:sugar kinase n=1 Tax=Cryobacterium sp. PH31-L1 TaxID=3046199 RepID=UPI0024BAE2A4|nr:sugar kinase [Cryobacterium sp. PH31-L1]MDJ0376985.1 sugar kinase [Cryobacterium sp. PH31-L1]